METQQEIYFYRVSDKFGYMSNFYKVNFVDENGVKFNCSEQFFMYKKCQIFDPNNNTVLEQILHESNPMKIKEYGRLVQNYNDSEWSELRYNIMINALRLKFGQNQRLKQKLLDTGNKVIYEASKEDKIWGIGFNTKDAINVEKKTYGLNLLGNGLMDVREELKNK